MNESEKLFRELLLAAEPADPSLRERYEKEVRMIFEEKLEGRRKWSLIGSLVLGLGLATVFGVIAVLAPSELPVLARIGFCVGALWSLAWAALCAWILRKGVFHRKTHATAMAGMSWGFVVAMIVIFMLLAGGMSDPTRGIQMVLNGLVFVVMGAVFLIRNVIEQSELRIREKILELELRLAELGDEMKKK